MNNEIRTKNQFPAGKGCRREIAACFSFFLHNRNVIEMTSSNGNPTEILSKIHTDLSCGLLYTHTRINANTTKTLEAASFLYALIEILSEKGLLTIEELDERKRQFMYCILQNLNKDRLQYIKQCI